MTIEPVIQTTTTVVEISENNIELVIGNGLGIPSGGTTGQVLSKTSNANYAVSWQDVEGVGGGVTDHGELDGLADDDHTQYHNDTRGDARYYTKSQTDAAYQPLATVLTNTTASFTTAQATKLSGIADGATANSSDATLLDRATHTGTQAATTVTVAPTGNLVSANAQAAFEELQGDINTINSSLGGLTDAVVLKGTWDASAGSFPASGTAQAGWSYIVSVAGTVDGVAFDIDDRLMAIVDNASATTFAANWHKLDYTDKVLSVNGQTGAVTLTTTNISEGSNQYFTNARAIAAPITGFISGAGTVSATDSILQAIQKIVGNIAALASTYVTLATEQTISALKTFSGSGSTGRIIVDQTSGSGVAVDITKAGNGEALKIAKTSGTGNAVTITGGTLETNGAILLSAATANTLASFDGSKTISSLSTATYPSLTEISYVKGVTSAIQTQFSVKASTSQTFAFVVEYIQVANQTRTIDAKAAFGYTIGSLRGLSTTAGSITLTVQINGTNVTGLTNISVTTTPQDVTATAANLVAAGDKVTFVFTSNSSAAGFETTLSATRVLA
jgi:hypothetical protein